MVRCTSHNDITDENDIVLKMPLNAINQSTNGTVFRWVAYTCVGTKDHEKAGVTAKSTSSLPETNYKVSHRNFRPSVLSYIQCSW